MPFLWRKKALTFWFLCAAGAVKDLSFLIDILPAYLFPNDERTIGEWVLAGFSLGGHATWLALRHGACAPVHHPYTYLHQIPPHNPVTIFLTPNYPPTPQFK